MTSFLSESFDLDARLRKTMGPLFFKPGLVPAEYVAGHRARFVPPVRLYVFASFAMFLVLSFGSYLVTWDSGDTDPAVSAEASPPASDAPVAADPSSIEERLNAGIRRALEDPQEFGREFLNRLAQAMVVLLPVFALLLKALYRGRLYVHHLVFAVYLHCFVFLVVAITGLPEVVGLTRVSDVLDLALLTVPVYLFIALRRFYGGSRLASLFKVFLLTGVYGTVGVGTMLSLIALSLLW